MPKIKHSNYDSLERDALRYDPNLSNMLRAVDPEGMRFDSIDDASIHFARELDYIKSENYDIEYPEMSALDLFPISHEIDEGAETMTYYSYDKTGVAQLITNYSDDLARADIKGKPTTVQIEGYGVSYGYSVQEMRASRYSNKSLDARKGEAARYACDNKTNIIAWAGDKATGRQGILSPENDIPLFIPPEGETSGTTAWVDKSASEIMKDINMMQQQVAKMTKNIERPDTLVLPYDVFIDISNRQIEHTGMTVKKFIEDNAPFLKTITCAAELQADCPETNPYGAYDESGQNVAILYKKDIRKFSLEIPMPFFQHVVQPKNLEMTIPCETRVAGVVLYYPLSLLIAVGI